MSSRARARPRAAAPVAQARRLPLPLLALAFAAVALAIYARALGGPFVSDDVHYVANNPYVNGSAPAWDILDPTGEAVTLVENYAPVHLLLHRAAWALFGPQVLGHHLVNLLAHVAGCVAFVLILRRTALPEALAVFGGAFLLVHPANVEAAAWISQLKSTSSLLLAFLTLLVFDRRPALATALFALTLFAKATAAWVWPVAIALWWIRRAPGTPLVSDRTARWLALWGVVFLLFAAIEFPAFTRATSAVGPLHEDAWVRLRTSIAFGGRYLVMAATGFGVAAFHEPRAATSLLDPWWLLGAAGIAGLAARAVHALRRRREEAAFWLWAGVAFLPVAQIFPFPFPVADRYLHMILPGLVGGALLALAPRLARVPRSALLALGGAWLLVFSLHAASRAALWRSPALLLADSARHYPQGMNAHLLRARNAALEGRDDDALRELRGALERGYDRFEQVLGDPTYAALHGKRDFDALIADMAGRWVERLGGFRKLSQAELYSLALAHRLRGEREEALAAARRGLALGGPLDEALRVELRALGAPP